MVFFDLFLLIFSHFAFFRCPPPPPWKRLNNAIFRSFLQFFGLLFPCPHPGNFSADATMLYCAKLQLCFFALSDVLNSVKILFVSVKTTNWNSGAGTILGQEGQDRKHQSPQCEIRFFAENGYCFLSQKPAFS